MSTARDYLAAVQQRADDPRAKYHHQPCSAPVCGSRHCQTARDRDVLVAALTAALDLHRADSDGDCIACGVDTWKEAIPWPCETVRVITDALTPKENDRQRGDIEYNAAADVLAILDGKTGE